MSKGFQLFKTILILIGIVLLTGVVGLVAGLLGLDPTNENFMTWILALTQLVFLVCGLALIKRRKKTYGENYVLKQGYKSDSWKMIFIGLGMAGFGNILISLLMMLLADSPLVGYSLDMVENAISATSTFGWILTTIIVVILAPIAEEHLFRGYFFEETYRLYGLGLAVFLNGLIFGLYHMNILQGVNTFFMGVALSLIYYYRGNLTDAIIVHMTNNAVGLITTWLVAFAEILGFILIACIFIGGYFFYKMIKENEGIRYRESLKVVDDQEVVETTIYQ